MTMALDVVAFLERATDDAKAMNFAGLCCLVRGSVIAGAPRAIRKGRRLSGRLDELRGGIQGGALNGTAPTKILIRLEGRIYVSIFVRAAYPRAVAFLTLHVVGRPCLGAEAGLGTCC